MEWVWRGYGVEGGFIPPPPLTPPGIVFGKGLMVIWKDSQDYDVNKELLFY